MEKQASRVQFKFYVNVIIRLKIYYDQFVGVCFI